MTDLEALRAAIGRLNRVQLVPGDEPETRLACMCSALVGPPGVVFVLTLPLDDVEPMEQVIPWEILDAAEEPGQLFDVTAGLLVNRLRARIAVGAVDEGTLS